MTITFDQALESFRYQLRAEGIDLPEADPRHPIEAAFRNAVTPVFSASPALAEPWPRVARLIAELRELGHQDAADLVTDRLVLKKDPETA